MIGSACTICCVAAAAARRATETSGFAAGIGILAAGLLGACVLAIGVLAVLLRLVAVGLRIVVADLLGELFGVDDRLIEM